MMELLVGSALHMLTQRTLYLVIIVTSLLARSVTSRAVVPSSHLLFYLAVEKQLMPQTADLADRALHILQRQCSQIHESTSQCLSEADQLPNIPALGDFPSRTVLKKEGSKMFTKHLLKEAYVSLYKLQKLVEGENEGYKPLTDLIMHIDTTRHNLKAEIESLYRIRIREKKYIGLKNSKKRFMKKSRTAEGSCPKQQEDCLTEADYRLRLLYTAYTRLLRVSHVLGYTVRLSWLAVEVKTPRDPEAEL